MTTTTRYIPTPEQLQAANEDRLKLIVMPVEPQPTLAPNCKDERDLKWDWGKTGLAYRTDAGVVCAMKTHCPHPLGTVLWFGEECWIDEVRLNGQPARRAFFADGWCRQERDDIADGWSPVNKVLPPETNRQLFGIGTGDHMAADSMPEWAARHRYNVTGVVVKRVQRISIEESCHAGIDLDYCEKHIAAFNAAEHAAVGGAWLGGFDAEIFPFMDEFDERHGPGSWILNPFCWFISIERDRGTT